MRTAGILVKEGVTSGAAPCIQVLEIGTLGSKRHPSDILPFLPKLRKFYQELPRNGASMHLKVARVPLSELECVTNTQVKVGGPIWYLNIKKGKTSEYLVLHLDSNLTSNPHKEAIKFADKELTKYTSSWLKNEWDEIDWSRINELQVREILDEREAQAQKAQAGHCLQCPNFLKHVSQIPYDLLYRILTLDLISSKCKMTNGK